MRNNEAADIRSCQRLHYLFNSSCQTFLFFFPCGPQCKDNKEDRRYYNKCCCTHNTISLMYTAFLSPCVLRHDASCHGTYSGVHALKLSKLSQKSRPFRTRYKEIRYLCARQGHIQLS